MWTFVRYSQTISSLLTGANHCFMEQAMRQKVESPLSWKESAFPSIEALVCSLHLLCKGNLRPPSVDIQTRSGSYLSNGVLRLFMQRGDRRSSELTITPILLFAAWWLLVDILNPGVYYAANTVTQKSFRKSQLKCWMREAPQNAAPERWH
jgi:hypothetical protein